MHGTVNSTAVKLCGYEKSNKLSSVTLTCSRGYLASLKSPSEIQSNQSFDLSKLPGPENSFCAKRLLHTWYMLHTHQKNTLDVLLCESCSEITLICFLQRSSKRQTRRLIEEIFKKGSCVSQVDVLAKAARSVSMAFAGTALVLKRKEILLFISGYTGWNLHVTWF